MTINLFETFVKIGANTSELEKGLNQAKKSTSDYRKDVMALAQEYKRQGMDMSSAMKKAYADIDKSQYETSQKSERYAERFSVNWDNAGKKIGSFAVGAVKSLGKITLAASTAAAAGIAALTKNAVESYAEYEQLVGGVDTLFKDASQTVQQYAADAYKTTSMSANDYMSNVTAFSASLIGSLGGDTVAAAEVANRAMTDISDNANKMGTDISSIVATYQSLSRGNFAMLDNLKLGRLHYCRV